MEIKNMRLLNGGSKVKAFFSIEWPGKMTVNDCKLLEGAKGMFAAMPSREYTNKLGEKKYQSIVYLEQDLLQKVTTIAASEYWKLAGKDSKPQAPESDDSDIPF